MKALKAGDKHRKTVWMDKTRDVKAKSNQKNKRWWNTHETHKNTKEIKQAYNTKRRVYNTCDIP